MIVVEPLAALLISTYLLGVFTLALAMIWVEVQRRESRARHDRHTRARHAMGKPGRRR